MRWLRRLTYWVRFRAEQADLRRELELHQRLLREEYERRGYTPAEADAAARRTMGNQTYMREAARGVWFPPRLEALLGDWRYAWRGLRRSPGVTTVAVLSLALGIGANTAIFGIIHSVLLARLPVPAATELVQLQRAVPGQGIDERFSRAEFDALATGPLPLAMFASSFASLDVDGVPGTVSIDAVDGRYFTLLGLRAERGRLIGPGDDDAPIAVITDDFWRTRLNADSSVIGRTITIDRHPITIIGVTPADYAGLRFPAITDVTMPYRAATTFQIIHERDARSLGVTIVGRRADGQSLDALAGELGGVWRHCCADGALASASRGQTVTQSALRVADISRGIPQRKLDVRGRYASILFALMAGVAILLLACCANVANLLLARSRARSSELAVRLALGASKRRVFAQLMVESAQLALLGGGAGILLAWWATDVLSRARIGDLSGLISSTPDASALAFTAAVSLACVVVCGLVPAISVTRTDLISPLRQSGLRISRGTRGVFDGMLVIAQVALALLLVSGAALLVQTLRNLQDTTLGFDPAERLALTVETRHTAYDRQGMTVQLAGEMLRRVDAIPGVRSAAFGSLVPVYGGRSTFDNVTVRGATPLGSDDAKTSFTAVTPGYFLTLGIPILRGRDLGPPASGPAPATREVVVNERFAKKFFPNRDPIGQVFQDADEGDSTATVDRIVGIVGDAKFVGVRAAPEAMYFVPVSDGDWPFLVLVVRPRRAARTVAHEIAQSVAAVAPGIGEGDPTLLSASVDGALSRERLSARLATLFGLVALCLVAIGLYGVLLYRVAERGREIGIRMALGADGMSVIGLVLRQSMTLVGIGIAVGLPLALLAGRAVASQLYGVAPYSIVVLAIATGLVVATATVACIVPVRRAIRIDPLVALRSE
ncbi:MAG TPA: ABC transporter permease [Gemmatimonadaceae bacterium]|nr:ABC transporter permease [Gemmatimonadaceae bacterium]